jgi:predicted 3-demethylubiquinone-9 3-methyltransferase (glyoxalase superfamily)
MTNVLTHIMFQGEAEKAVELYSSVFKEFQIGEVEKYGEGEQGEPGTFKLARVSFAGHELLIFDSPPVHDFSFTPSMSLFVNFDTQDELEVAFSKLSQDGEVMMPLDNYGFSKRFAWIADRFGVSWQLNLS